MEPGEKRPCERQSWHNRLQKLALGVEESREYWRNATPSLSPAHENVRAFEERWFGARTMARVRVLMADMRARYAAFPSALQSLKGWQDMHPDTRRLICHWHLQLADPAYRAFSADWLPWRREGVGTADFPAALRWIMEVTPKAWQVSTGRQMAGKLLAAAAEAGLVEPAPDPRRTLVPRVPDEALGYCLHLLREVDIAGSILDNPYLRSVGLTGVVLESRLAALPWVRVARLGGTIQMEWQFSSLAAWTDTRPDTRG